ARPPTPPTDPANTFGREPHDRHIAFPTTIAAGVAKLHGSRSKPKHLYGQLGNLGNRDIVTACDVVDVVGTLAFSVRRQHGFDHVINMDVGLALPTIAQDIEMCWIDEQPLDEVVTYPMRLPRPDNVAEAK